MAITNITLTSSKTASDGIIEVGLGESIPVNAIVEGDISNDKIDFVLRKNIPEIEHSIVSVTSSEIKISGVLIPNQYKNKIILLDKDAILPKHKKSIGNNENTIYFSPWDNISTLTGTDKTLKVTNIIQLQSVPVPESKSISHTFYFNYNNELTTSAVAGNYLIEAYWTNHENEAIPEKQKIEVDVKILSVWQLKEVYFAGLNLQMPNPEYLVDPDPSIPEYIDIPGIDDIFRNKIAEAIDEFERVTQLFLWPRKIVSNPQPGEVYDIAITPRDYYWAEKWLLVKLPHHHIISVDKMEGWYGSQKVFTWNQEWYLETSRKRTGIIQCIPRMGGMPYQSTDIGMLDFAVQNILADEVPAFWHVDYTAGWDELERPLPLVVRQIIGQAATIGIAPIISDALTKGIASSSVSFDGLSESKTTTANSNALLLQAKINQYSKENQRLLKDFMDAEIPYAIGII